MAVDEKINGCSPQVEDGYTRIANGLFEAIILRMPWKISDPVLIFLAVMRETYGFGRKSARISTERFRKITGIAKRQNIHRAIKKAASSNIINVITSDDKKHPTYSIQKDFTKWVSVITSDYVITSDDGRHHQRLRLSSPVMTVCMLKKPLKETIKKKRVGQLTVDPPTEHPPGNQKPEKKRRQLPPDFALTEDMTAYAKSHGLVNIESVFSHFCDHHRARGNTMLDWEAAWRTWVRNEKKFNRAPKGDMASTETRPSASRVSDYDKVEDPRFPVGELHNALKILETKGPEAFENFCDAVKMPRNDRESVRLRFRRKEN